MTTLCSPRFASSGEDELRVRVSRQSDGSILIVGRSLESIENTRERLVVALLVASAGAVAVAGLLGAWLVRVGLRPLTRGRASGERDHRCRAGSPRSGREPEHRGGAPGGGDQPHARSVAGRVSTSANWTS